MSFKNRSFVGLWACLALVFNAAVWGMSWWPLRELGEMGIHPLWASAWTYCVGVLVVLVVWPKAWFEYCANWPLWVLSIATGLTMVGFNWGVAIGDVIRVVLLFYLMPVWAALLAWWLLGERLTGFAIGRIVLALMGAVLVLSPSGRLGFPMPASLGEWLGLMGGAGFAFNNVLLKHQHARSSQVRLLAMFVGGLVGPGMAALALSYLGAAGVFWPTMLGLNGMSLLLGFTVLLLVANLALQYGASRLPANVTSVMMLSEVLFATTSAMILGGADLTIQVACGGVMIFMAAVLSVQRH